MPRTRRSTRRSSRHSGEAKEPETSEGDDSGADTPNEEVAESPAKAPTPKRRGGRKTTNSSVASRASTRKRKSRREADGSDGGDAVEEKASTARPKRRRKTDKDTSTAKRSAGSRQSTRQKKKSEVDKSGSESNSLSEKQGDSDNEVSDSDDRDTGDEKSSKGRSRSSKGGSSVGTRSDQSGEDSTVDASRVPTRSVRRSRRTSRSSGDETSQISEGKGRVSTTRSTRRRREVPPKQKDTSEASESDSKDDRSSRRSRRGRKTRKSNIEDQSDGEDDASSSQSDSLSKLSARPTRRQVRSSRRAKNEPQESDKSSDQDDGSEGTNSSEDEDEAAVFRRSNKSGEINPGNIVETTRRRTRGNVGSDDDSVKRAAVREISRKRANRGEKKESQTQESGVGDKNGKGEDSDDEQKRNDSGDDHDQSETDEEKSFERSLSPKVKPGAGDAEDAGEDLSQGLTEELDSDSKQGPKDTSMEDETQADSRPTSVPITNGPEANVDATVQDVSSKRNASAGSIATEPRAAEAAPKVATSRPSHGDESSERQKTTSEDKASEYALDVNRSLGLKPRGSKNDERNGESDVKKSVSSLSAQEVAPSVNQTPPITPTVGLTVNSTPPTKEEDEETAGVSQQSDVRIGDGKEAASIAHSKKVQNDSENVSKPETSRKEPVFLTNDSNTSTGAVGGRTGTDEEANETKKVSRDDDWQSPVAKEDLGNDINGSVVREKEVTSDGSPANTDGHQTKSASAESNQKNTSLHTNVATPTVPKLPQIEEQKNRAPFESGSSLPVGDEGALPLTSNHAEGEEDIATDKNPHAAQSLEGKEQGTKSPAAGVAVAIPEVRNDVGNSREGLSLKEVGHMHGNVGLETVSEASVDIAASREPFRENGPKLVTTQKETGGTEDHAPRTPTEPPRNGAFDNEPNSKIPSDRARDTVTSTIKASGLEDSTSTKDQSNLASDQPSQDPKVQQPSSSIAGVELDRSPGLAGAVVAHNSEEGRLPEIEDTQETQANVEQQKPKPPEKEAKTQPPPQNKDEPAASTLPEIIGNSGTQPNIHLDTGQRPVSQHSSSTQSGVPGDSEVHTQQKKVPELAVRVTEEDQHQQAVTHLAPPSGVCASSVGPVAVLEKQAPENLSKDQVAVTSEPRELKGKPESDPDVSSVEGKTISPKLPDNAKATLENKSRASEGKQSHGSIPTESVLHDFRKAKEVKEGTVQAGASSSLATTVSNSKASEPAKSTSLSSSSAPILRVQPQDGHTPVSNSTPIRTGSVTPLEGRLERQDASDNKKVPEPGGTATKAVLPVKRKRVLTAQSKENKKLKANSSLVTFSVAFEKFSAGESSRSLKDKLESLKFRVLKEARNVHGRNQADRLFAEYWVCLSKVIHRKGGSESDANPFLERFLKTKKLRKAHNRMILGILKMCESRTSRFEGISECIPEPVKGKVRRPKERAKAEPSDADSQLQPGAMSGMEPIITMASTVNPPSIPDVVTRSQLRIPGSLAIDPVVRFAGMQESLKVSETVVWLLTVAAKEYASILLKSCANIKKAAYQGTHLRVPQPRPHTLMYKPKPGELKKQIEGTQKPVYTGNLRISSFDIHNLLAQLPMGPVHSLGGTVSRMAYETTLMSSIDRANIFSARGLEEAKRFIVSKSVPAGAKESGAASVQGRTVERQSPHGGLGKGAKDLASLRARSGAVSKKKGEKDPPPPPQDTTKAAGSSVEESRISGKDGESKADEVEDERQSITRKGKGSGVKNLRAMIARNKPQQPDEASQNLSAPAGAGNQGMHKES